MSARQPAQPDSRALADLFRAACELDVLALKPGNVRVGSPGHGMHADDFINSARAAAPHVTDRSLAPGERIYRAIEATRAAVGCNTNLGIVLLAVPLLHAAQCRRPDESLAEALHHSLGAFDLRETDRVYRAIRLASPAGLGSSPRHDVQDAPSAPLLTAMREAAAHDDIAREYASGFAELLGRGRAVFTRARERWGDESHALSALFLVYLADRVDTHIVRKRGRAVAENVRQRARVCLTRLNGSGTWGDARPHLDDLDRSLKSAGINPGTSADLCVATWLATRIEPRSCQDGFTNAVHGWTAEHSAPQPIQLTESQQSTRR